jgi:UDPglucose--hexose-1-phosphate uridylyltransferase
LAVQRIRFDRADGRYVLFYSFDRPPPEVVAVAEPQRGDGRIELRRDELLGEDVIVSTGRQERTFLPPPDSCPLCPTAGPDAFPTEIPAVSYEIAVFENRFPSFRPDAPAVLDDGPLARRSPARGACEVVLYSPEHEATLASLGATKVRRLADVWADRYAELGARPGIEYVFVFENRGREIGVTLTHPHGQIYAFPYVPPRVEQEERAARDYYAETAACLQCDLLAMERGDGRRVVGEAGGWLAYVPFAARMPYQVHLAPAAHRASLLELTESERDGLAQALCRLQATYDALWGFAMPYTMSMHQQPTGGHERPFDHLHIEFLPPYRTRDKLKYLAGVETGAGTFINDTAPEETAAELRRAWERAAVNAEGGRGAVAKTRRRRR